MGEHKSLASTRSEFDVRRAKAAHRKPRRVAMWIVAAMASAAVVVGASPSSASPVPTNAFGVNPQGAGSFTGPLPSVLTGVNPARILDTRTGVGAAAQRVAPGGSIDVQVTGQGGVPAANVLAVVLNVTVTQPTAQGYITAWPTGEPRPDASNLNFTADQTIPNLVIVKVGAGGRVSLFNSAGSTHLIADVSGYYTADSQIVATNPTRILDTRTGVGGIAGPTRGAQDVQVGGQGGVPPRGASAVILNVTMVQPTAAGYMTVYPTGASRPDASNINVLAGETRPNLVIAKLGAGGKVSYFNNSGSTHVIFDVLGYVTAPPNLTELLDQVGNNCLSVCFSETQFQSNGSTYFNSLRGGSVSTGGQWQEYNLGREWTTLATTFAFDDTRSLTTSRVRFRILGDGVPLADETISFGQTTPVSVNVTNVLRIRFEVTEITGNNSSSPGFLDPKLAR